MKSFQEEQAFLIVVASLSGLYMPSLEKVIRNRILTTFIKCLVVVPLGIHAVFFCTALSHLIELAKIDGKEFDMAYECGMMIGTSLFIFKCGYHNLNRNKFEKLFDLWDASFAEDLFPERRRKMFIEMKEWTNKCITALVTFSLLSCFVWTAPSYFCYDKTLPHPSGLNYKHESPDYEFVVTYEVLVGLYAAAIAVVFDSILLVLLSLEDVQLLHLKISLSDIVNSVEVDSGGRLRLAESPCSEKSEEIQEYNLPNNDARFKSEKMEKMLRLWISHHQQLIRFHEQLRKTYYTPLCAQFSSLVSTFCVSSYVYAIGGLPIKDTVVSGTFLIGTYAVFYITCNLGDHIKETSESIYDDSFDKAWYVYPKPIKSVLRIVMMKAQTPMDIVAFDIYPLGASSFLKIFKTAYSLLAFLLQTTHRSS